MSDCQQWIEAAMAQQGRAERAEHDLAAARAALELRTTALVKIRARTYSTDRGCALKADAVAEISDISEAALSRTPETKP